MYWCFKIIFLHLRDIQQLTPIGWIWGLEFVGTILIFNASCLNSTHHMQTKTETPPPGRIRVIAVGSDYGGCHARQLKYGTHFGWSTCFGRSLLIMSLLWIDTRSFVDNVNSLLTAIACSATQVACFASLACLINNNQVASVKHQLKVTCKLKFRFLIRASRSRGNWYWQVVWVSEYHISTSYYPGWNMIYPWIISLENSVRRWAN